MCCPVAGNMEGPSADGLQAGFYKDNWSTLSIDVVNLIKQTLAGQYFWECINTTDLVLIPKTNNPISPLYYKPISLCNVIYKIIAKILRNRIS